MLYLLYIITLDITLYNIFIPSRNKNKFSHCIPAVDFLLINYISSYFIHLRHNNDIKPMVIGFI